MIAFLSLALHAQSLEVPLYVECLGHYSAFALPFRGRALADRILVRHRYLIDLPTRRWCSDACIGPPKRVASYDERADSIDLVSVLTSRTHRGTHINSINLDRMDAVALTKTPTKLSSWGATCTVLPTIAAPRVSWFHIDE